MLLVVAVVVVFPESGVVFFDCFFKLLIFAYFIVASMAADSSGISVATGLNVNVRTAPEDPDTGVQQAQKSQLITDMIMGG